ncbi:hypothetical protein C8F04DRAFT_1196493 [Mycena alexandri]|uniref:Uncharacterized protein n=1 Tax=Mycena alexandri TaxID=1745969 RepID=A0AAD6S4U5_9AGAR|nr:hypothetical protein C8F04DRAFT_1196493 [Mycena alexandri]
MVATFQRRSRPSKFWSANRAARRRLHKLRRRLHPPVHVFNPEVGPPYTYYHGPPYDWNDDIEPPTSDWTNDAIPTTEGIGHTWSTWGTGTVTYGSWDDPQWNAPFQYGWGVDGESAELARSEDSPWSSRDAAAPGGSGLAPPAATADTTP